MGTLVRDYSRFKQHACRQTYANLEQWNKRKDDVERSWPAYTDTCDLISTPAYLTPIKHTAALYERSVVEDATEQRDQIMNARKWLQEYNCHVQLRQEKRQNHVHRWDASRNMKMPLTHCQSADNPKKCKFYFPRTTWLVPDTVVLCRGLLKDRKMPWTGKKNMQGMLHGPMNDENLNGCLPAMLAGCPGLNFNNDVQIPFRFLPTKGVHASDLCSCECWLQLDED